MFVRCAASCVQAASIVRAEKHVHSLPGWTNQVLCGCRANRSSSDQPVPVCQLGWQPAILGAAYRFPVTPSPSKCISSDLFLEEEPRVPSSRYPNNLVNTDFSKTQIFFCLKQLAWFLFPSNKTNQKKKKRQIQRVTQIIIEVFLMGVAQGK